MTDKELRARAQKAGFLLIKSRTDGTWRYANMFNATTGLAEAGRTFDEMLVEIKHFEKTALEWRAAGRPQWTHCGIPLNEAAERITAERKEERGTGGVNDLTTRTEGRISSR